jgi:hypothetical protein
MNDRVLPSPLMKIRLGRDPAQLVRLGHQARQFLVDRRGEIAMRPGSAEPARVPPGHGLRQIDPRRHPLDVALDQPFLAEHDLEAVAEGGGGEQKAGIELPRCDLHRQVKNSIHWISAISPAARGRR